MNNRGVADWIRNLVSLIITAIGLVILFMYVSAQFGVFFGSGREDDAAKAGFHSFVNELNDLAGSPKKFAFLRDVPLTTDMRDSDPFYSVVSFPDVRAGIGKDSVAGVALDYFDGSEAFVVPKPDSCSKNCVCLFKRSLLSDKPTQELLDCAVVDADFLLTQTVTDDWLDGNLQSIKAKVSQGAIYFVGGILSLRFDLVMASFVDSEISVRGMGIIWRAGNSYVDPLEDVDSLKKYFGEYIDPIPKLFTSRTFRGVGFSESGGVAQLVNLRSSYYVEKTVNDKGRTFLLILPNDVYASARAELFNEKFGDPVAVLKEKIAGGNDSKIISFADKKFSELFESAKTAEASSDSRIVALDNLKNFASLYLSFLLDRPSEKLSGDKNAPLFLEEASRIVRVLLDDFGSEIFVKEEAIKLFEKAQSTVVSGRKILEPSIASPIEGTGTSKLDLYSSVIRASTVMDPKTYTLLKNIADNKDGFWRTVLYEYDNFAPQRLFKKLEELSATGTVSEKQKSFYLQGIAFKNYPLREERDKINLTKRFYNKSIIALNSAISIDPSTLVANDALSLRQELCSWGPEKIGVDGVGACES